MTFVEPEALHLRAVVEAGWGERPAPGHRYLNTDSIEDGYPTWRLRPIPQLATAFSQIGLKAEDALLVTGSSAIAAARVTFALLLAGAEDVAMLNCRLPNQEDRPRPGQELPSILPSRFGGRPRPEICASLAELEEAVATGSAQIADVRSAEEFRGEVSGYSYLDAKGRIPGSIHAGDADDRAGLYVHPDGRLRAPEEIAQLWSERGLEIESGQFAREVIFVCGGGWRASLAFLFARALGLTNARVCPDGWAGWSTHYIPDGSGGFQQIPTGREILVG